jgi:hypothetical protein
MLQTAELGTAMVHPRFKEILTLKKVSAVALSEGLP